MEICEREGMGDAGQNGRMVRHSTKSSRRTEKFWNIIVSFIASVPMLLCLRDMMDGEGAKGGEHK